MLVRCTAPNAINEQPYSGRFAMWQPSQVGDVSNAIAALLVASGSWAPHSAGLAGLQVSGGYPIYGQPIILFQSAIPFIVLGGDGSANGMRWSASTDGTFTMNATSTPTEPLTGLFTGLTNVMALFYLTASAGGAANTAGWYWGKITSATAGIIYNNTYISGDPGAQIPASPSAFTSVANGWINQGATTTDVAGLNGITLPGGMLGPNGTLDWQVRTMGDTTSTKNFKFRLGGTLVAYSQPTGFPDGERLYKVANAGVLTRQIISRSLTGVGNDSSSSTTQSYGALNTAGDLALREDLSFASAAGNFALVRAATRYVVYPG